jgi:hypothetical protein
MIEDHIFCPCASQRPPRCILCGADSSLHRFVAGRDKTTGELGLPQPRRFVRESKRAAA